MSAFDLILRRRNALDNGSEEVIVSLTQFARLTVDSFKNLVAGGGGGMQATATVLTTAGAGTYLAAAIITGVLKRDPNGANRTDTTDTAAHILTAAQAVGQLNNDYDEIYLLIVNTADAAETITLAGGVGVTLQAAITVAQASATRIAIMRDSATTVIIREV